MARVPSCPDACFVSPLHQNWGQPSWPSSAFYWFRDITPIMSNIVMVSYINHQSGMKPRCPICLEQNLLRKVKQQLSVSQLALAQVSQTASSLLGLYSRGLLGQDTLVHKYLPLFYIYGNLGILSLLQPWDGWQDLCHQGSEHLGYFGPLLWSTNSRLRSWSTKHSWTFVPLVHGFWIPGSGSCSSNGAHHSTGTGCIVRVNHIQFFLQDR